MAEIIIDIRSNNAESRLSSLRNYFERTDRSIDSTVKSVGVLNKGIVGLVGTLGGLYGVKSAFDSIQGGFKTLETASLEVSKTTGLVGDDLKRLTNELDNMSTTMGGFEVRGLYSIAESAGQLGIKGVDNLKNFTKEMQYMASSSKLTAEEASTGFAEIANALNMPISDINKLTSSFSKLASTTTADEGKLLDFTQRLAGAGKTLGLTNAQIVAVGATMKDVGVNVEVGGTAMSQVFQKMLKDTESFAKVSNVSLEEYSKMIDEKPVKALEKFLESLGKLDKRAKIKALDEMKLSGSGLSSTLLKLSTNTEKLNANIKTSSDAYVYGKATQDEYKVASESLANQQTKTESAMLLLQKTIGDGLKPAMIDLNNATVDAIKWAKENGDTLEELAVVIGSVSVAYIALTNAQKIQTAWTMGQGAIGMVSALSSMSSYSRGLLLAKVRQRALNMAMRATPWGIFITGATEALYHADELADSLVELSIKMGLNTELAQTRAEISRKTKENAIGELALETRRKEIAFQSLSKREQANIIYTQQLKVQKGLQAGIEETLKNTTFSDKAREQVLKNMGDNLRDSFLKTQKIKKEFKDIGKEISKIGKKGGNKNKDGNESENENPRTDSYDSAKAQAEREAEQRIEQLKRFDDAYQKSTLSNYEYSVKNLMKQRDDYDKLGADKLKIEKWFNAENDKLLKSKTDKEKKEQEKLNEYNISVKQSILDYEAKQTQKKVDAEKLYHELLGDKSYDENLKYWEIKNTLQGGFIDLSIEEIKQLEQKKKLNEEILSLTRSFASTSFDSFIGNLKDGVTVKMSVSNALDAGASSMYDSMKGSSNPYLQAVGYGVDFIEAIGTDLIDLQTDIGADSKSFVNSMDRLNDLTYKHTPYFQSMDNHLANMDVNFGSLAKSLYYGSTDYTGADFTPTDKTGSLGSALVDTNILTLGIDIGGFGGELLDGVAHFISNSKTTLKKSGIEFGDQLLSSAIEGIDVQAYQLINKKSSLFGVTYSNKDRMKYSEVDDETEQAFTDILADGYSSILDSAILLGISDVESNLADYVVDIGALDFKDKSEAEIMEELEGVFSNQFNQMAIDGLDGAIDAFNTAGEEYFDTLTRVAMTFDQSSVAVSELNLQMADFTNIADNAHLDYLATDTSGYISSILSEEEQLAISHKRYSDALATVDLTLPETREEYQQLVESLDLNNELDQERYSILMQGADGISSLIDSENDLAQASIDASSALSDFRSDMDKIATDYKDWYNTKGMTDGEAYSYTLMRSRQDIESLMGELNVKSISADTFSDVFANVNTSIVDDETLSMWDELGNKIKDVTNLEAQRIGDIDNFLKDTIDTTMGLSENYDRTKSDFYSDPTTDNASSYLNYLGETSSNQYDYNFEYARMANTLQDTAKVDSPTYTSKGAMIMEDTTTSEKVDDLAKQLAELASNSTTENKEQIEKLETLTDRLEKMMIQQREDAEIIADATERASHQKVGT